MGLKSIIAGCIRLSIRPVKCEEFHLTRFLLYRSLRDYVAGKHYEKVAAISGSERLCELMGFPKQSVNSLIYPEHDLRRLKFPDNAFDACVSDQVLEHIEADPFAVMRESARIVRSGGLVVHATVMTFPTHFGPKDLWRFTPEGLKMLFESSGLRVLSSGSWGGATAVALLSLGLNTLPVPVSELHPIRRVALHPGPEWPVVVWAVGEKLV